jgi:hypothetical protein
MGALGVGVDDDVPDGSAFEFGGTGQEVGAQLGEVLTEVADFSRGNSPPSCLVMRSMTTAPRCWFTRASSSRSRSITFVLPELGAVDGYPDAGGAVAELTPRWRVPAT